MKWLLAASVLCVALVGAAEVRDDRVQVLAGDDHDKRIIASQRILADHRRLVADLVEVVKTSRNLHQDGPRHMAIVLLGQLRAEDAADTLSDNLAFLPDGGRAYVYEGGRRLTEEWYPCAEALARIGGSKVFGAMVSKIAADGTSPEERHLAAWVFMQVAGDEGAIHALGQLADESGAGQSGEQYREAALYLKHWRPRFDVPISHAPATPAPAP